MPINVCVASLTSLYYYEYIDMTDWLYHHLVYQYNYCGSTFTKMTVFIDLCMLSTLFVSDVIVVLKNRYL